MVTRRGFLRAVAREALRFGGYSWALALLARYGLSPREAEAVIRGSGGGGGSCSDIEQTTETGSTVESIYTGGVIFVQPFVANCTGSVYAVTIKSATANGSALTTIRFASHMDFASGVYEGSEAVSIAASNTEYRIALNNPVQITNGNTYYVAVRSGAVYADRFNLRLDTVGTPNYYMNLSGTGWADTDDWLEQTGELFYRIEVTP